MNKNQANEFVTLCKNGDLKEIQAYCKEQSEIPYYALCAGIHQAIIQDRLNVVAYFLTSNTLEENCKKTDIKITSEFLETACENGKLQIVKFLLTDPLLKEKIDVHSNHDVAINKASSEGHLEIVDYLLTDPEIKRSNIKEQKEIAFLSACSNGYIDIIEYCLTSSKLTEKVDIHTNNEMGLKRACFDDQLEVVKYLLMSPNLQEHADIKPYLTPIVKKIVQRGFLELTQYLCEKYEVDLSFVEEDYCNAKVWKYIQKQKQIQKEVKHLKEQVSASSENKKFKIL